MQKTLPPDIELLKSRLEHFHRYIRWGDFRSAQKFLVPERRMEFLKAVIDNKDDENLKITEYELQDAELDGTRATALSKVSWHRLPSVTTRNDGVLTHWEYREGDWLIVAIDDGPLPIRKRAPVEPQAPVP